MLDFVYSYICDTNTYINSLISFFLFQVTFVVIVLYFIQQ